MPVSLSKRAFHSHSLRIIECPSRKAATENSIGIVGTSVGVALVSNALRPAR
jgi:hypothetical protein